VNYGYGKVILMVRLKDRVPLWQLEVIFDTEKPRILTGTLGSRGSDTRGPKPGDSDSSHDSSHEPREHGMTRL